MAAAQSAASPSVVAAKPSTVYIVGGPWTDDEVSESSYLDDLPELESDTSSDTSSTSDEEEPLAPLPIFGPEPCPDRWAGVPTVPFMPSALQKYVRYSLEEFMREPKLKRIKSDTMIRLARARDIQDPETMEGTRDALLHWDPRHPLPSSVNLEWGGPYAYPVFTDCRSLLARSHGRQGELHHHSSQPTAVIAAISRGPPGDDESLFWEFTKEHQKLVARNSRDIRRFFDAARQFVVTNTQYVASPEAWAEMIRQRCAYPSRAHAIITASIDEVLEEVAAFTVNVGGQPQPPTPLKKAQLVIDKLEARLNAEVKSSPALALREYNAFSHIDPHTGEPYRDTAHLMARFREAFSQLERGKVSVRQAVETVCSLLSVLFPALRVTGAPTPVVKSVGARVWQYLCDQAPDRMTLDECELKARAIEEDYNLLLASGRGTVLEASSPPAAPSRRQAPPAPTIGAITAAIANFAAGATQQAPRSRGNGQGGQPSTQSASTAGTCKHCGGTHASATCYAYFPGPKLAVDPNWAPVNPERYALFAKRCKELGLRVNPPGVRSTPSPPAPGASSGQPGTSGKRAFPKQTQQNKERLKNALEFTANKMQAKANAAVASAVASAPVMQALQEIVASLRGLQLGQQPSRAARHNVTTASHPQWEDSEGEFLAMPAVSSVPLLAATHIVSFEPDPAATALSRQESAAYRPTVDPKREPTRAQPVPTPSAFASKAAAVQEDRPTEPPASAYLGEVVSLQHQFRLVNTRVSMIDRLTPSLDTISQAVHDLAVMKTTIPDALADLARLKLKIEKAPDPSLAPPMVMGPAPAVVAPAVKRPHDPLGVSRFPVYPEDYRPLNLAHHLHGHRASVAYVTNRDPQSGISITGRNGRVLLPKKMLFDTGADVMTMSSAALREGGFESVPYDRTLTPFGGEPIHGSRQALAVPWVLFRGTPQQLTVLLNTLVMDPCSAYDAIAGTPLDNHLAVMAFFDVYSSSIIVRPDLHLLSQEWVAEHGAGRAWSIPARTAHDPAHTGVLVLPLVNRTGRPDSQVLLHQIAQLRKGFALPYALQSADQRWDPVDPTIKSNPTLVANIQVFLFPTGDLRVPTCAELSQVGDPNWLHTSQDLWSLVWELCSHRDWFRALQATWRDTPDPVAQWICVQKAATRLLEDRSCLSQYSRTPEQAQLLAQFATPPSRLLAVPLVGTVKAWIKEGTALRPANQLATFVCPLQFPDRAGGSDWRSSAGDTDPVVALLNMYRCFPCTRAFLPQQWVQSLITSPRVPTSTTPEQGLRICTTIGQAATEYQQHKVNSLTLKLLEAVGKPSADPVRSVPHQDMDEFVAPNCGFLLPPLPRDNRRDGVHAPAAVVNYLFELGGESYNTVHSLSSILACALPGTGELHSAALAHLPRVSPVTLAMQLQQYHHLYRFVRQAWDSSAPLGKAARFLHKAALRLLEHAQLPSCRGVLHELILEDDPTKAMPLHFYRRLPATLARMPSVMEVSWWRESMTSHVVRAMSDATGGYQPLAPTLPMPPQEVGVVISPFVHSGIKSAVRDLQRFPRVHVIMAILQILRCFPQLAFLLTDPSWPANWPQLAEDTSLLPLTTPAAADYLAKWFCKGLGKLQPVSVDGGSAWVVPTSATSTPAVPANAWLLAPLHITPLTGLLQDLDRKHSTGTTAVPVAPPIHPGMVRIRSPEIEEIGTPPDLLDPFAPSGPPVPSSGSPTGPTSISPGTSRSPVGSAMQSSSPSGSGSRGTRSPSPQPEGGSGPAPRGSCLDFPSPAPPPCLASGSGLTPDDRCIGTFRTQQQASPPSFRHRPSPHKPAPKHKGRSPPSPTVSGGRGWARPMAKRPSVPPSPQQEEGHGGLSPLGATLTLYADLLQQNQLQLGRDGGSEADTQLQMVLLESYQQLWDLQHQASPPPPGSASHGHNEEPVEALLPTQALSPATLAPHGLGSPPPPPASAASFQGFPAQPSRRSTSSSDHTEDPAAARRDC